LLLAVDEGHANIVDVLLARQDIEVNIPSEVMNAIKSTFKYDAFPLYILINVNVIASVIYFINSAKCRRLMLFTHIIEPNLTTMQK
jgi:hypothetical protein